MSLKLSKNPLELQEAVDLVLAFGSILSLEKLETSELTLPLKVYLSELTVTLELRLPLPSLSKIIKLALFLLPSLASEEYHS
jgi:hypothetical protein